MFRVIKVSADHHFEYQRADLNRLRLNNFKLNGGILKVIGLELAKRSSVLCLTYYTMSDLTTPLIAVGLTDAKGAIASRFTV